jgi:serine/threonine-protein kinase
MAEPDEPRRAETENDPLELGIQVAFGVSADLDTPTLPSALEPFRQAGRAPQVSLRDDPAGHSRVVLPAKAEGEQPAWRQGRYRVAGEIARGGVGSILRARDVDLGREVALKVLLDAHRGNAEITRRFLEEAQVSAQLQHPGVVPVHEIGLLADERPYFAMKLVKGQTLAEILESRADPSDGRQRLLGIFAQICQTLAYAHTRGVVHRDLKPSNVMVGTFGEVQVMDWGFAKVMAKGGAADDRRTTQTLSPAETPPDDVEILTARSADSSSRSVAGSVMGTPAYMPPEQARGAVDEVDERSDVFGLGAILCEILTGKPAYTGRSLDEVYNKARRGEIADARQRLEVSGADRELIELAESCLSIEPRERPRNAVVVSKRISGHLESVARRAHELEVRAAKTRLKFVLVLSTLIAVVLGGGAYVWVDKERRAQEQASAAAVRDAMSQAKELRAQAASKTDPSLWDAALREAKRALDLSGRGVRSAVVEEARALHAELAAQVRDHQAIAQLDRLREERDSDPEELEESFRDVFGSYGIDVDAPDIEVTARKIRESGIARHLVLALDQWAITWAFGPQRRARSRPLEIAQLADDDKWRSTLRQAVRANDRERLNRLAEEAASAELAPSTLEVLAFALRGTPAERGVWLRAQELYPHDFWINLRLGDFLRAQREFEEALQFLRAAAALRPGSAYALYKLGSALADKGSFEEALTPFERAIASDAAFPSAYYRCADALEEGGASLPRERLDRLRLLLERTLQSGKDYHDDGFAALRAEVLLALGESRAAIVALERSVRVRGGAPRGRFGWGRRGPNSNTERLERHRKLALPDLLTFASIDAALEDEGPEPFASDAIAEFRQANEGRDDAGSKSRLRYLEGRRLEDSSEHRSAAAVFEEVLSLDDGSPEPFLRLAESLRAAGEAARAEKLLREALGRETLQYTAPWKLWLALSLSDLKRSAGEALAAFPEPQALAEADPGDGDPAPYGSDLRRLLELLAAGKPVEISLRFFPFFGPREEPGPRERSAGPGRRAPPLRSEASRSQEAGSGRIGGWSFAARARQGALGYEIPLPAGTYDVEIEFQAGAGGEGAPAATGTVELVLEGKPASGPLAPGDGAAGPTPGSGDPRRFQVTVSDGFLDVQIGVPRRRGDAWVSALVIRKQD